jgi:hypothetical protein
LPMRRTRLSPSATMEWAFRSVGTLSLPGLGLYERGEYDDVGEVVTGVGVEHAAARHELQCGIRAVAVHELVGEIGLGEHAHPDHRELEPTAVVEGDEDPTTDAEAVEMVEDRRAILIVHVAQDHRGSLLAGGRSVLEPSRSGVVARDTDGPVGVEAEGRQGN